MNMGIYMTSKVLQSEIDRYCQENQSIVNEIKDKSFLILGGTGMIGSQVIHVLMRYNELYDSKIRVLCVSRSIEKMKTVFEEYLFRKDFFMVKSDISQNLQLEEKIDYIIHGANTTSSKEYIEKSVETITTIINGTEIILRFAMEHHATVLYLSSMEIYGQPYFREGYTYETDKGYIDSMSVRSSYSEGKRAAECLCKCFNSEYGLDVKVARLAQVFGPGVPKTDNRIFSQLAKSVINQSDFVMHSSGNSEGNYCYSLDAVMGILTILIKGEAGQVYNVVNEATHTTIREMAEMVSTEIAGGKFRVVVDIPKNEMEYGYAPDTKLKLSAEKLESLGWRAKVGLKEMYVKLINSMK